MEASKKLSKQERADIRSKNVKQREGVVKDLIKSIADKNGAGGMQPANIIAAYKKNNEAVLNALKELKAQISPISQSTIAKAAMNKLGKPSMRAVKEWLTSQRIDYSGISNAELEDLIALDDWGTLWNLAKPLLLQYGVPVLKNLWKNHVVPRLSFVPDKYKAMIGGDEGFNSADWAGNTTNPYRYTFNPSVNVSMKGISPSNTYTGIHDLVSTQSIKSILSPELCKHRYAYTEMQKVALAVPAAEYSIVSNASGQVGIGIFTRNVVVAGGAYSASYLNIYNDATFSVATGTQTPTCSLNAGLLSSSLSSFDAWRHNVTAVTFLPTASLNTAGAFTFGYNNRYGSASNSATNIGVTLAQIKTWPYVTSFNNKTSARFTSVYGDVSDDTFINGNVPSYYQNQYMVLLGSGLPASTEVGRLQIQCLVEFIPALSAFPICPIDYPQTGPLTEQFESLMYQRWPVLQMADLPDVKKIIDGIPDEPMKYHDLFNLLSNLVCGIQPREYVSHASVSNPLDLPVLGGSFDFASE